MLFSPQAKTKTDQENFVLTWTRQVLQEGLVSIGEEEIDATVCDDFKVIITQAVRIWSAILQGSCQHSIGNVMNKALLLFSSTLSCSSVLDRGSPDTSNIDHI